MRTPLVMGNWKLHGSSQTNTQLVQQIIQKTKDSSKNIAICPPCLYLSQVSALLKDSSIKLGAQTMDLNDTGAFTGDISPLMLQDVGCQFVILGHSERRQFHNESDDIVARKFKKAIESQLIPVLCVGESPNNSKLGKVKPW